MATEIVRWCDVCMTGDERVAGAEHTVQLDARSGTIDLCPEHTKALLAPIVELLTPAPNSSGRKLEPGPATCIVCDQSLRPERMGAHLAHAHRTTLGELYGLACPVCDRVLGSPHSFGPHAKMHGVDRGGLVALWAQVAQDGDPDGRLRAVRARASDLRK